MDNLALSGRGKALLTGLIGLVAALLLGIKIGGSDYNPLLISGVVAAGMWLFFFTGQYYWLIAIASSSLAGTFPVLRGSFTPFQILMAMGVAKFFAEDVVLKRRRIAVGPSFDRLMICGFIGIVTLHAIHDRFGMRFLGSTTWGGRNYVNIYVAVAAYFVIQTIPIDLKVWRKLPFFVLAVTSFDTVITLVTTLFPRSIYIIYPFYSGVSRTGIEEIVTGDSGETARLGAVGNFGVFLITLLLASCSVRWILHPSNLGRLLTLGLGYLITLFSSFRTSLLSALAVTFVAGIRDLKSRVLLVIAVAVVLLFGLSFVNSHVFALPRPIQRSLTFVPGHWDVDMARDAANSNEWRTEVWNIWLHDYFPAHPLIGRGFGFASEWATPPRRFDRLDEQRVMVAVGNIHNGLYSTLDCVGVIGTLFFAIWSLGLLIRVFRLPFNPRVSGNTVLWFVALGLGASIICYWLSAQIAGTFVAQQLVASSVFLRLREIVVGSIDDERKGTIKQAAPTLVLATR
jgi:hypothetical protein